MCFISDAGTTAKTEVFACIGCGEIVDLGTALDCGLWEDLPNKRLAQRWVPYYACNEECRRIADNRAIDWLLS